MDSNSKIYVAGNTGLVGSAIVRMLKKKGFDLELVDDAMAVCERLKLSNQEVEEAEADEEAWHDGSCCRSHGARTAREPGRDPVPVHGTPRW